MNDSQLQLRTAGLKSLFGSQFVNIILSVVRTFFFTLYLAPKDFGLMALSISFTGFIGLIKEFGYSVYIIQKQDIQQEEINLINSRIVILGAAAFMLICLVTIPIAKIYNQRELLWILPIVGVQFIFNGFTTVPYSLLKKDLRFNKIAIIDISSNVISIATGLIVLFFIRNYWVLLVSSVSYFLFQMILTNKIAKFKISIANPFDKKFGKESNYFGTRLTMFNIFTFISVNIDNIIIAKLFGSTALGIYSKSYEFGISNFEKLKNPIQQVYFSEIALESKDNNAIYSSFLQYLYLLFTILIIVIGPVLILLDILIPKIFGAQWSEMSSVLPPFLITSFLWMAMSLIDQLLVIKARLNNYVILGSLKAIIGLASIIVASFWKIEAIAWSFLIYHIIIFVPFCKFIIKDIGFKRVEVRSYTIHLVLITLSTCLVIITPWFLIHYHITSLFISALILLAGSLLLFFFVWPNFNGFRQYKTFISTIKFLPDAKIK